MKNKKGFTLIELLAVIIVLSIISFITIPIVTDTIDKSKNNSEKISVQNYIDAVNISVSEQKSLNPKKSYNGIYKIVDNGKSIQRGTEKILISYKGKNIESGKIVIEKGSVKSLLNGKINDKYATLYDGKLNLYEIKDKSTLVSGQTFNSRIKTLVNGTSVSYNSEDKIVTEISFYSNGFLPEGYTSDSLVSLPSVSLSSDDKVKAYYDSDKTSVYVYSENQICITDATNMFMAFRTLNSIKNLHNIDTSNLKSLYGTFNGLVALKELDLSSFDTSKVTTMDWMFASSSSLKTIDLSSFDTSNITSMPYAFYGCSHLETIDLSSFNTSKVTNMNSMFRNCFNLTNLDLSSFDTSNVTAMTSMFNTASKLKTILVSDKWVIGSQTTTTDMFTNCGTSKVTIK